MTIDFGDGRVLKRTLTGNTVMYLCLPDGSVIDALPGVYTPSDFLNETRKTLEYLRKDGANLTAEAAREWHKQQVTQAITSERIRTTMGKRFVESPLLSALGMRETLRPVSSNAQQPLPLKDVVRDPRSAFEAVSARIEDLSKQPASAEQLRAEYAKQPPERQPTPEELGRRAVEMDSRTIVTLVRPAVHLLFATYDNLPSVPESCDAVCKRVLDVPIDDPNFGLIAAIVPGTSNEN